MGITGKLLAWLDDLCLTGK